MARQPFSGKMTIIQFYHDSTIVVNGKKVTYDQNALDLSPRGLKDWRIKAPLLGEITRIVKEIAKKLDGYFELKTKDGFFHCFVHSLINEKIPLHFKSKEGGRIGDIDPTPVNATGAHCHYFILDKNRKPVDILKYYINLGIYPNDWLLDPFKLIPKGKYQMSKPKTVVKVTPKVEVKVEVPQTPKSETLIVKPVEVPEVKVEPVEVEIVPVDTPKSEEKVLDNESKEIIVKVLTFLKDFILYIKGILGKK